VNEPAQCIISWGTQTLVFAIGDGPHQAWHGPPPSHRARSSSTPPTMRGTSQELPDRVSHLGDARLVLRQMIRAVKDLRGAQGGGGDGAVAAEITQVREGG